LLTKSYICLEYLLLVRDDALTGTLSMHYIYMFSYVHSPDWNIDSTNKITT
jgi:hypothetical protein